MIILDTTVISAAMARDAKVVEWVRSLPERPITTVVNSAEIFAGIAILPDGARKRRIHDGALAAFDALGACLPVTLECAEAFAEITRLRRAAGRPISGFDALIASVAIVSGSSVATRDTSRFEGLGLAVIDPWA